ncbi:Double-stranded DNA-binding domain containing protein [Trichomonas vaginalis G3]|uniref:Double-stranded DNA-binding domain containing protein n=1 Tax=Trichomonas vaginalis (strain ATCC PRA-98 / G3) TaxID=412133 RepID=A2D8K0_TRIV3|nr:regulation of protein import into mitochondrial outer membrane [Trichomonas vaginalis G3]EAY23249.1 Double-stranded DNA-binding domain containing protein [Trichomonas vaginalis G3]KAI5534102.1 regulation of protein import into mitochondrial outer membrane [Trichomonas vaginalis G3]|eukprot:XP_001584235.1 Double-stranded DNA-binding domain containing protein [Trichomonas vaginalis G3]
MNSQQQQQKAQEEKAKQMEEQRKAMLDKILSTEAKERLGRISLVKPEKSRLVEDLCLQMAQQNNLGAQISDAQLMEILNKVSASEQTHEVKIKHHGKADEAWDDDDEGW